MKARDVLAGLRLEDGRLWIDAAADWQLADALAVLEGDQPYHFLTRARGASKTTDLAAVGLALLLTAEQGSRLYWLASDEGQGGLAIDSIAGFVARTPRLGEGLDVQSRRVVVRASGASLTVLPADAPGAWGLRPGAVFADELAQWRDSAAPRRLWEAVSSAVAKLPGSRLVVLTTAGAPEHFSRRVLDHAIESPMWRVNEVPGPAPWMAADRLEEQRARLPESSFARLFLNEWVEGEDRLTTLDAVRDCVAHEGPLERDPAHKYVVALDLGLKRDRTAAVVAHREGERVVLDRLAVWQGSRLRPVQLDVVEAWVKQACDDYGRAPVTLDPWQTVGLAQRLRAGGLKVTEFAFTAQSVGRLAGTLFNLLRDRALALPDDAELIDELAHVRLRETSPGVFRMDHAAGRHDDRAVALALAATHLLREPPSAGPARMIQVRLWGAEGRGPLWHPNHDGTPAHAEWHQHHRRCERCFAEARARAEAPPPAPPEPERVGRFLVDRPAGRAKP